MFGGVCVKMNVSLVYPAVRYSGFASLGNTHESLWINHGVTSLAACLKQAGYTVKLYDLRDISSWGHFKALLLNDKSIIFGVSMATLDFHEAVKAATIIRSVKPKAKIVVGGPHPSICPEQVSKQAVFDYVVKGEGEVTFPKLVANPDVYPRVIQGERVNLDKLPIEDRSVFNLKKIFSASNPYTGKEFFPNPFVNVLSGRGCVFRCGFCKPGEDMIFGKFRMRSLDHFMSEIRFVHEHYHPKTLMIDDDSFTLYPDYVKRFCDEYRFATPFVCQSRVDFICRHPDLMKQLKYAGLDTVFIGFESGSQRMLDFMKKDATVEQNFRAAEICRGLGIKIWANYMVGLPTETKEEMQATFDMIAKIKPEHPSGAFFTPIVGTELYDYCVEHDLLFSSDPSVLGSRNPSVPKIKGVDYGFMRHKMFPARKLWRRVGRRMLDVLRCI